MPKQPPKRPFADLIDASVTVLTAADYRELIPDSRFFVLKSGRPATAIDTLTAQALESLRQSAGINRGVDIPLQSALDTGVEDIPRIQAALSQASPVDSGRLAASWLNGESWIIANGDGTYTLDSQVPYARINDLGGDTGRDGKTHIYPSYYVASAEAAAGLEPDSLRWVDGKLAGAGGVGVRGVDLPATASLLNLTLGIREAA